MSAVVVEVTNLTNCDECDVKMDWRWRWEEMCGPGGLRPWEPDTGDLGYCFRRLFILIPALFLMAAASSFYVGRRLDYVVRGDLQRRAILMRGVVVAGLAALPLAGISEAGQGVDYLEGGAEVIAWAVHFWYLMALRRRLGASPRGPVVILMLWSVVAVLSVASLRTLILTGTTGRRLYLAAIALAFHALYALTLIPSEGVTAAADPPMLYFSHYSQIDEHYPLVQDRGTLGTAFAAPFLSRVLFRWVDPLFDKGLEEKLRDPDDLHELPSALSCAAVSTKIDKALIGDVDKFVRPEERRPRGGYGSINEASGRQAIDAILPTKRHNVSLLRALHSCFAFQFYGIGVLRLLADICGFAGPLLLNRLVDFVENPAVDSRLGYAYASALMLSSLMGAFADAHFNMSMAVVGLKLKAAIISTVFRKTLSVASAELNKNFSVGQITNFMSTDTDRIVNSCPSFHAVWSIPLQLGVTLYLLYTQVGIAFLAGVLFSIVLIPINRYVATKIGSLSTDLMRYKDSRVSLMTELVRSIRTIKLYVWEEFFADRIEEERKQEIKYLKGRKYLDAVCVFLWATTPAIVATLTLSSYALTGRPLTAATVFTTIALLNMLIAPLNAFPWVLNGLTEAWVSIKRIQALLDLEDMDPFNNHENDSSILNFKSASFIWPTGPQQENNFENEENMLPFSLSNLSFEVTRGEFLGVVGKVGSGKTSLLHAILSEMTLISGNASKWENISSFGYVGQKPWLRRGTIKDNIIFGKAFEETKYKTIIDACCLTDDLMLLGSNACIGEGGSSLSGGQAARIALARAVYQDNQVYLLDDVLSSVDVKVGNHIYHKCIMGLLKYKTRILVTHSVQYLVHCDRIFQMENGKIVQQGPPAAILNDLDDASSGYEIGEYDSYISAEQPPLPMQPDQISMRDDNSNNSMLEEEISAIGGIDFQVILLYWKSIGNGIAIAILLSLTLMQISRNTTDLWLSHWVTSTSNTTSNGTTPVPKMREDTILEALDVMGKESDDQMIFYLSVYAGFALLNAVFTLFRAFLFAYGGIQAAITIHKSLLKTIIKGTMKFFDLTPAGRLLNRFSSDTYTIDDSLPFIMNILLAQVFGVIGSILLTIYGLPWVCLVIVPLMPIYHWLQHRYRITSRDLKRLSSVTLSPVYSHFNDTLEGATVIRAFGKCNQWSQNGEHHVDRCQQASLSSSAAAQWLSLRLQLMGSAILTGGAVVAVAQRNFDTVNAGLVGLAISYALSMTSLLSGVINAYTETEREMIAVERVGEYINCVEAEETRKSNDSTLPYGWPNWGIICFDNVVMKYRPHLAPSLKGISFETNPGEKIGIVGRTGAGKSSLFASIFRLCELHSGSIKIDHVDIAGLTLANLRSHLSIIPQEPFVFKGSVRKNLDPFGQYADPELWSALEKCGAKRIIRSKGGLHVSAVDLSRGHLQLICLTRAILQNSKVLCIDEATANIDQETDRLIQETIRCVFRRSTVLTIAHRISTVLDSDRIIVMGEGRILEFDKPEKLLNDQNSHFYRLVHNDDNDLI